MRDANEVTSRDEMFGYFGHGMARQVDQLIAEHVLEAGRGLLKTYVLEVDPRGGGLSGTGEPVRSAIGGGVPGVEEIEPTRDRGLLKIVWAQKVDGRAKRHVFFLDTEHDRMWKLYGDSTSEATDKFWRSLIKTTSWLDGTWLPRQFFDRLSTTGLAMLTGVTSKFVQRVLGPAQDEERNSLSVKVWGTRAPDALEALRQLHDVFALTGLRLRYYGGFPEAAHDEITFDGKVTSWGRSIEGHNELVRKIFDQEYLGLLTDRLEKRFRIRTDERGEILGEPAYIKLTTPIVSMEQFAEDLLSPGARFRLVEIDRTIQKEFARIVAVDEHAGQSLTLEVVPKRIRVMLSREACGNTLLRILTTIQQDFDPAAELVDADDIDVFA
jgi:hypothetical protein